MKEFITSTLYVGLDVSARQNVLCALDFSGDKLLTLKDSNNSPGAENIAAQLKRCLLDNNLDRVTIALESTSFYSVHIANYLSACDELMPFHPMVYCLNPKTTARYKETFVDMDKTDPLDAFVIADFARAQKITTEPWRGAQFLALQRLTRHRLHVVESIAREKVYMLNNIYLKFSELAVINDSAERPFSDRYSVTAQGVLTEFLTLEDIAESSLEELVLFVRDKGKNRFVDAEHTAKLLQKAARNSYRLDKVLYEPLNLAIASSFNIVQALQQEIKIIDKGIVKQYKGINTNQFQCLLSIPGIGPTFASGILSEIGTITAFSSNDKLAKYAGLTWRVKQSGPYTADVTRMTKTGNKYLRYYLIEAANCVRRYIPEYKEYYHKKYDETTTHQHKRALALTARKLVRLIFKLLSENQLYSSDNARSNN